jgi:hypothetical protein
MIQQSDQSETSSYLIHQSLQSLFPPPSARVQPEDESSQRLSP